MKLFLILSCSILLIGTSANTQNILLPDSQKRLDSLIDYNYGFQSDSIRKTKIEYIHYDRGSHTSLIFYRWQESGEKWVNDYTISHNKIDLFFNAYGDLERETKYLWNSASLSFSRLSELNRDYDMRGNLIYEVLKIWDMQGRLLRGHFMNFEYDSDDNMVFENKCDWNDNIINWWGKYQYTYDYDSHGNKVLCTEFIWDADDREWSNHQKEEWTHNSSGSNIGYHKFSWDVERNEWISSKKYEREINPDGIWHIETSYSWDDLDSLWIGDIRKVRSFDSRGNWTLELSRKWYPGIASWKDASKQVRTFDLNGNILVDEIYSWDLQKSYWKGYKRIEKAYDNSGNPIVILDYSWNSDVNSWSDNHRTELDYSNNGEILSETHFVWNSNAWLGSEKKSRVFDSDSDLVIEYNYLWNGTSSAFEKGKGHFYYYGNTSSIREIYSNQNIKIFPNPGEGIINISGLTNSAEIGILTIQGTLIKTVFQVDGTIDISGLAEGIYILKITSNGESFVRQIVVMR